MPNRMWPAPDLGAVHAKANGMLPYSRLGLALAMAGPSPGIEVGTVFQQGRTRQEMNAHSLHIPRTTCRISYDTLNAEESLVGKKHLYEMRRRS